MNNGYIQLHSGRYFSPIYPNINDFTLYDVVHGISGQPRFAFHTKEPYYVIQHCVIMARWFIKRKMYKEATWALWHEGEEGLGLGDMPTPIKYLPEMEPYRVLGKVVQQLVFRKVGLIGNPPPVVKELDTRMFYAEAKVLLRTVHEDIKAQDTSDIIIKPYQSQSYGKKAFVQLAKQLTPNINLYE